MGTLARPLKDSGSRARVPNLRLNTFRSSTPLLRDPNRRWLFSLAPVEKDGLLVVEGFVSSLRLPSQNRSCWSWILNRILNRRANKELECQQNRL